MASSYFKITMTANTTLALSGWTATVQECVVEVIQNGTGGWVLTLPSGVAWQGGIPPVVSLRANSTTLLTFTSVDNGVTVNGHGPVPVITLSPGNYGAVGDGVTDDSAAINAALAACPNGSAVGLNPPTGNGFAVGSTIVIPADVALTQLNGNADSFGLVVVPGSNLDAVVADNGWYNNLTASGSTYFATVKQVTINPHDTARTSLSVSAITTSSTAPQITATAHGLSIHQGICIRGVPGLNGGYTVASVVDANNITIAANYPLTYGSGGTLCHGQGHAIAMSSFHAVIQENTINGVTDGDGIRLALTTRAGSVVSGSINEWRICNNHVYMAGDATGNYSGGAGINVSGSNITDGFIRDNIVSGAAGPWAVSLTQAGGTQVTGNHVYHYQQSCMRVANIGNGKVSANYLEGWLPTQVANMGEIDQLLVTVNAPGAVITDNTLWTTGNGASGNTYYGIHVNSGSGTTVRPSAVVEGNSLRNDCTTATGTAIYYDDTNANGLDIATGVNAIDVGPTNGGWVTDYGTSTGSTASINKYYNPWLKDVAVVPSRQPGSGGLLVPPFISIGAGTILPATPNSWPNYCLAIPVDVPQAMSVSGMNFHLSGSGTQGGSGTAFLSLATAFDDGTGTAPAQFTSVIQEATSISPTQATGEISASFSGARIYQPQRYWMVLAFQLGSASVAMSPMPTLNTFSMVSQIGAATLGSTGAYAWLYQTTATGGIGQVNPGGGVRWGFVPALALKAT